MLFKAELTIGDRKSIFFLNTATWFEARNLCRQLYQIEAYEPAWRALKPTEEGQLKLGDRVFWFSEEGVQNAVVRKLGSSPVPPPKPKTQRKPKK
jgi:hypothetical protein